MRQTPWSTASAFLRLRDELIEAGWNGEIGSAASPRPKALCTIEATPTPELPPGASDRLQAVFSELEALTSELPEAEPETDIVETVLEITAIMVLDDPGHLPPSRHKLFALLTRCGVAVAYSGELGRGVHERPAETSAPDAVAAGEAAGAPNAYPNAFPNAEVELLTATDEWEAVAAWLAAGTAAENEGVTLVCAGDSSALDMYFPARIVPSLVKP